MKKIGTYTVRGLIEPSSLTASTSPSTASGYIERTSFATNPKLILISDNFHLNSLSVNWLIMEYPSTVESALR